MGNDRGKTFSGYLGDKTRLVEEVPGVPENIRWFLWHDHKTVWSGPSEQEGRDYATAQSITIDAVEYFEP